MNDIDDALRTMLRERAEDITTHPDRIASLEQGATHKASLRPVRTIWLVAAAIVAVLAVVGVTVAVGHDDSHHGIPPASHTPSPTTIAPQPHIERKVALSWFGMSELPGYAQHIRRSEPGYRVLAVRGDSDTGTPIGCNGCELASDYIYVYDAGVFDSVKNRVSTWQHVTVNGKPAFLGTMDGSTCRHTRCARWPGSSDRASGRSCKASPAPAAHSRRCSRSPAPFGRQPPSRSRCR